MYVQQARVRMTNGPTLIRSTSSKLNRFDLVMEDLDCFGSQRLIGRNESMVLVLTY
jgi:hypothetical protein